MSTWNAVYFRGSVPPGFRPLVVGPCPVRWVADWLELSLAGVVDGEPTALALSRLGSGQVIWVVVQTAFARKTLETGDQRPWPREWETFFHAIGVSRDAWRAAQAQPPLVTLQGNKVSKLKVFSLAMLVLAGLSAWAALR